MQCSAQRQQPKDYCHQPPLPESRQLTVFNTKSSINVTAHSLSKNQSGHIEMGFHENKIIDSNRVKNTALCQHVAPVQRRQIVLTAYITNARTPSAANNARYLLIVKSNKTLARLLATTYPRARVKQSAATIAVSHTPSQRPPYAVKNTVPTPRYKIPCRKTFDSFKSRFERSCQPKSGTHQKCSHQ